VGLLPPSPPGRSRSRRRGPAPSCQVPDPSLTPWARPPVPAVPPFSTAGAHVDPVSSRDDRRRLVQYAISTVLVLLCDKTIVNSSSVRFFLFLLGALIFSPNNSVVQFSKMQYFSLHINFSYKSA
jgi:hypothetical protein